MNNNIIKIVSVIVLLLFAGLVAMPFFSHSSCDMDCCVAPMDTTCEMDMGSDSCCPTVSECRDVVYIPIVTAPLLNVNVEKDLTVDYLTLVDIIPNITETVSTPFYQLKILTSEAPPGFQTPLLV